MSLAHILLGMLREPATGYELGKRFKRSLAHFWHADLAQIYPTLNRLEQQRCLSSQTAPSESGPPRRLYTRTAKGKLTLQRWLIDGPDVGKERIAHLAQTYFMGQLDSLEESRKYFLDLRQYYSTWHAELADIQALADLEYQDAPIPHDRIFPYLTIRNGVLKTQASVTWCDECLDTIDTLVERS